MEVVEQFIESKTGSINQCEDIFFVNEHYAAVIDGATNVSGQTIDGLTPGQLSTQTIRQSLEQMDGKADISIIIDKINSDLIKVYQEKGIYENLHEKPHHCPSASMALFSREKNVIWMIGDCKCMIDDELHEHNKVVDEITANARSLFLESEILKGKSTEELMRHDTGFEAVLPLIQKQYYFQNIEEGNPYSYEVINGFNINLNMMKTVPVPSEAKHIVLASDGYPYLYPDLEQSESALQRLLEEDPLCFRQYKCAKGLKWGNVSFDDRTYIKVRLNR